MTVFGQFGGGAARAAETLAARCATGRVEEWPLWDAWAAGRCGPAVDVSRLDVPALFTIGWFDTFGSAGWRDVAAYDGPVSVLGWRNDTRRALAGLQHDGVAVMGRGPRRDVAPVRAGEHVGRHDALR